MAPTSSTPALSSTNCREVVRIRDGSPLALASWECGWNLRPNLKVFKCVIPTGMTSNDNPACCYFDRHGSIAVNFEVRFKWIS